MHIESLPVRSSHYTREKNKDKQYLDLPDREPHAFLYQKYLEWLQINHPGVKYVKDSYYQHLKTARDESLWDPNEWTVICIDL